MYLMRSRRKVIKPPVQDKAVEGDAPANKSKTTGTDQKSKDQTDGMCVFYVIDEHLILYHEIKLFVQHLIYLTRKLISSWPLLRNTHKTRKS